MVRWSRIFWGGGRYESERGRGRQARRGVHALGCVCMYVCMCGCVILIVSEDRCGGDMETLWQREGPVCVDQMWRWALLWTGKSDARPVTG